MPGIYCRHKIPYKEDDSLTLFSNSVILISLDYTDATISVPEYSKEYLAWLESDGKDTTEFMTIHSWGPFQVTDPQALKNLMRIMICLTLMADEDT